MGIKTEKSLQTQKLTARGIVILTGLAAERAQQGIGTRWSDPPGVPCRETQEQTAKQVPVDSWGPAHHILMCPSGPPAFCQVPPSSSPQWTALLGSTGHTTPCSGALSSPRSSACQIKPEKRSVNYSHILSTSTLTTAYNQRRREKSHVIRMDWSPYDCDREIKTIISVMHIPYEYLLTLFRLNKAFILLNNLADIACDFGFV